MTSETFGTQQAVLETAAADNMPVSIASLQLPIYLCLRAAN